MPCFFCVGFLTTLVLFGNHGVPPCMNRSTKVYLLLASLFPPMLWYRILAEWQKGRLGHIVAVPLTIVLTGTVLAVVLFFDSSDSPLPYFWIVPFLLVESVTAIIFVKVWQAERRKLSAQESH